MATDLQHRQGEALKELIDPIESTFARVCGERQQFILIVFNTDTGDSSHLANTPRDMYVSAMASLMLSLEQGEIEPFNPEPK